MERVVILGLIALGVWMLGLIVRAQWRDAEDLRRSDHGLCRGCGHDLRGATGAGRCFECGRPFRPFEAVRIKPGSCTACGYDLRASNVRCPECGKAAG